MALKYGSAGRGHLTTYIEDLLLKRLVARVAKRSPGECWEWQGSVSDTGYGQVTVTVAAHRIAKVVWGNEPPPDDGRDYIDHLCNNKRCCNPSHLEWVTPAENNLRRWAGTCKRGHNLSTHAYISPSGRRQCRTCRDARMKNYVRKVNV